ncbi:NADPH:quinone reductase-like Zn-dependent oxidoreductase [Streptomyces sp. LBL]|uniref:NADP-dependent oxidoreductase n=1 Tax=Streptomyces sp. LBL TaxID=2940562 RepID=UPI002476689B|nr:NADP-dependent oxidoreductase [Streptomyces sp. LBL]MDH6626216.1 NADPH:quinone reductase-like Zn-dependent oxidoreductase [Streptomyces sp. LBL]
MPDAYGFTRYGGPEEQRFLDLPKPVPGPDELLVEVYAAGVNPVDWGVRAGKHRAFLHLEMPAVLGREAAGVVEQLGEGVDGFAVGDPVFGTTLRGGGCYARYALLTAGQTAPKPPSVSFTDAAALPVAAGTAHDCVNQLGPTAGQTLLILGIGGGVGVAAAQLARDAGVSVVGTASAAKREFVESLGATAIDYDGADFGKQLDAALPNGADTVLDLVGGGALDSVSSVISPGCRVISATDPETAARFGALPMSRKSSTATLTELARRVAEGRLDPQVRAVFPFEDAEAALREVESGHPWGKVVLDMTSRSSH